MAIVKVTIKPSATLTYLQWFGPWSYNTGEADFPEFHVSLHILTLAALFTQRPEQMVRFWRKSLQLQSEHQLCSVPPGLLTKVNNWNLRDIYVIVLWCL